MLTFAEFMKKISSALISVYYKEGLEPIVQTLHKLGIKIYSTGGTQAFIEGLQIPVVPVETLTGYPSILGGRVKTLHPAVFGGILFRRDNEQDVQEAEQFNIPPIDLVIVDLYPFEETVQSGAPETEIIEKIDIGGISLIRAAAKNFKDTLIVANKAQYKELETLLVQHQGASLLNERRHFAEKAFAETAHYDSAIHGHFAGNKNYPLRYGENPHQEAHFTGNLELFFTKHQGKELSYNNLLDIDAAVGLILDFPPAEAVFAIIKHNNACGIASRKTTLDAWKAALQADPVSAFGGILCCNQNIDPETAQEIDQLFFEVIIAPHYDKQALEILQSKKNRIILELKHTAMPKKMYRSVLNGMLVQDRDTKVETTEDLVYATTKQPSGPEIADLLFANKVVKHTRSNAIVLVKGEQLLASGTGQTSRVDALQQAIHKAKHFGFELKGAVMASDAFFPFPDCVEIAHEAGITAVIQPGGSIKDALSVDYCNKANMSMVMTGHRHFRH